VIRTFQNFNRQAAEARAGGGRARSKGKRGAAAAEDGAAEAASPSAAGGAAAVRLELEGRSSYMRQVAADRDKYAEMLQLLAGQISTFKPTAFSQVLEFVHEMERRLALLSDERAVVKTLQEWPESKVEALREIVGRRRELTELLLALDCTAWEPRPNIHDELQRTIDALGRVQPQVEWYTRSMDEMSRRWKTHTLLFDFKILDDIRHASVPMAKHAMRLYLTAHERWKTSVKIDATSTKKVRDGLESSLRFAFRCHQFAEGFDEEASSLFAGVHEAIANMDTRADS